MNSTARNTSSSSIRIPFNNLRRAHDEVAAELSDAFARVTASGVFILGREVEAFEHEWAEFCGARAAAGVATGTDALALALLASGAVRPGAGDEVITTPLTAPYTALAILNAGAIPVFADINPQTLTLDPRSLGEAVTPRTRAVIPVHLYGQMADMPAICREAAKHKLVVIEDAAQAHGARLEGRSAGEYGAAAAFSFYPTKNLGAFGDGGAVVSNDADLIERVKILRQGGHDAALDAGMVGRNSRLDELQAALLRVKLKRLAEWNERRRALAAIYDDELSGVANLQLPIAPREPAWHVYHLYVAQHPSRDRLRASLIAQGIETLIHYPRLLHREPIFHQSSQRPLPVAESTAPNLISLPLHPHLSVEEARVVAKAVAAFID